MKASIVIPSYNSAGWIGAAVESCRLQTFGNIEIIIVNDGSTDSTPQYLAWLEKQRDKRIRIINQENKGRSEARNRGNQEATGDIILVLDADDLCFPKRAELTVNAFKSGADVVYGSAIVIDAVGRKHKELIAEPWNHARAIEDRTNRIVHSSLAYRRELTERFKYRSGELSDNGLDDWALVVEMSLAGLKFRHIANEIAIYRHLDTGISKTRDLGEVLKVKDRFLDSMKVPA